FAGGQIAMAAVCATLEVLVEDDVPARAAQLGEAIRAGLEDALSDAREAGLVREIRSQGLLFGIEFDSPQTAGDIEIELVGQRVIPNHCLNHHAVVRFTPQAFMTESEA